jgi:hypothetical protein
LVVDITPPYKPPKGETFMHTKQELKNDLRVLLARLNEHYPDHASIIGIFSAPTDNTLAYEFLGSGEKKLEERLKVPQNVFYSAMIPVLSKDFEEHHKTRPGFGMEWFIMQGAWQQGIAALVETIAKQIWDEAVLHSTPPNDPLDLEVATHVLDSKGQSGSSISTLN